MSKTFNRTPTKRPADGGIMRFFTVTPKIESTGADTTSNTTIKTEALKATSVRKPLYGPGSSQPASPAKPTVKSEGNGTPTVRRNLYSPLKPNDGVTATTTPATPVKAEPSTLIQRPTTELNIIPPNTHLTSSQSNLSITSATGTAAPVSSTPLTPTSSKSALDAAKKWAIKYESDDSDSESDSGSKSKSKRTTTRGGRGPVKRKIIDSDASASEPSDSGSGSGSDSDDFINDSDSDSEMNTKSKKRRAPITRNNSRSSTPSTPAAKKVKLNSGLSSTPAPSTPSKSSLQTLASFAKGTPSKSTVNNNISHDNSDEEDEDGDSTTPGSSQSQNSATLNMSDNLEADLPLWVLPQNRKDSNGRLMSHPDYDERTLYIPPQEFAKFTPATKQFWTIKKTNFDVVLFFKMGKFYELFDNDAEIGIRELGLLRMGVSGRLHAGFPEIAFSKHAEKLVALGYKVGRVEQTQTPKQLAEANKNAKKGEKLSVVRREMCEIVTKSTLLDSDIVGGDHSSYLLSIFEIPMTQEAISTNTSGTLSATPASSSPGTNAIDAIIGICFVDAASGTVHVGRLYDDRQRTKLRTLFTQARPCEVTYCKNGLTPATEAVLRSCLPAGATRSIQTPKEYASADAALEFLQSQEYFHPDSAKRKCARDFVGEDGWPLAIAYYRDVYKMDKEDIGDDFLASANAAAADSPDSTTPTVDTKDSDELSLLCLHNPDTIAKYRREGAECLLRALGGCVAYLHRLLVDKETISLCNVRVYSPTTQYESSHLVLDGQTLYNLEILENQDGGKEGSLLAYLDHCVTPFGRRMLRNWVARPLGRIADINARLDAVEELLAQSETVQRVVSKIKKVPDLERMIARVRSNGMKVDNAVMYENIGKSRVELFLKTLKGFGLAVDIMKELCEIQWSSTLLQTLLNIESILQDVSTLVKEFNEAFDHAQAAKDGHIIPQPGIVVEYDNAVLAVQECEKNLQVYLDQEKRTFKDQNIQYFHRMREVYQLEIPLSTVNKIKIPTSYEQISQTKTVRRYYTAELRDLISDLESAKEIKESLVQDVTRRVFYKFAMDFPLWSRAVSVLAEIDCLCSLATVSRYAAGGVGCRPEFVPHKIIDNGSDGKSNSHSNSIPTHNGMLELRDSIHPSMTANQVTAAYDGAPIQFIPNDIVLGAAENPSQFVLVSGPNMGGKSTLLRQVCCAVIMAQIGCFVSSEKCVLTPCDRIFTRVGANDRIMQGQSTFLVELEETSSILRHATARSLVILDELGRGTSTFDGTSIAYAVIDYLANKTQCLTLFSTHYHMLLEEFKSSKKISMYHMACEAKVRHDADGDAASDMYDDTNTVDNVDITFLYKFIPGICSKSFGMNVATLAGLPRHLVLRAQKMSELFEEKLQLAHKLIPMEKSSLKLKILQAIKDKDINTLQQLHKMVQV